MRFLITLILNTHMFLPVFTFHEYPKGQVKQKSFNYLYTGNQQQSDIMIYSSSAKE